MKVEIVSCKFQNYWYSNKIGEVFEVENPPMYQTFYRVIGNYPCIIKKGDCKEVFEVIHKTKGKIEVIESTELCYQIAGKAELIWKDYCQPIEQEKEMKQEFTKSDLKNFMRVKYRNGNMRVYIDGRLYHYSDNQGSISSYDFNLKSTTSEFLDIIEVYEEPSNKNLSINSLCKLIWQREEKSEQEIELEKLQEQIKALEKQAQKLKDTLK